MAAWRIAQTGSSRFAVVTALGLVNLVIVGRLIFPGRTRHDEPATARAAGRQARHAAGGSAGVTRIVQTDDLPPGIDALASADGKTVIVRASLDQVSRRRAMREVMASVRGSTARAYPGMSLEASVR